MKSMKNKKPFNRFYLFIVLIFLGLVGGIWFFISKQPKVLGVASESTYTKETLNFGLYGVALYYPSGSNNNVGPYPVIFFSHGMASKYDYYNWFAKYMVKKGYIVVLPNRLPPGVDLSEGKNLTSYLLRYLSLRNKFSSGLKGKVDLNNIGLAGHSMGAAVALYSAGIPKVKAIFDIAPPSRETGALKLVSDLTKLTVNIPLGQYIKRYMDSMYATISKTNVPIMYLVGSLDSIVTPEASKSLYGMTNSKKALLILNGANHVQFSPTGTIEGDMIAQALDRKATMTNDKVLELTSTFGGAWFDYFIKGDLAAKSIIDQGDSLHPGIFSDYQLAY